MGYSNTHVMDIVQSHLNSFKWLGSSHSLPYGVRKGLSSFIEELWSKKILPIQVSPVKWIVGYSVYMSFSSIGIHPITVGPAKPTKHRSRHSKIEGT